MTKLKIQKIGDSLVTVWPESALAHLHAKEGDTLEVVETAQGFFVVKSDKLFEETMTAVERVIDRHQNAYRELAKK